MEYRILGPLEVRVDDRGLDLGPKKQRSLFALLLINHNRTVSTDRILDALWGEDAEGKENALWVYVSRLRSILDEVTSTPVLVTKDHGYSLEIDPAAFDAAEFERLSQEGIAVLDVEPRLAAETLDAALRLWRGNALEDFTYEEFTRSEIARLSELRRTTLDARIEADLLCGKTGELIGELELEVDTRPYDETPIRQLMLALYRSGRQTEALRAFERFRTRLGDDTGTEPSPELRRLEEQILFHDSRLTRSVDDEPAHDVQNPYRGLEAFREEDSHVFFGRDSLVADLLSRLADQSIVTAVGPSGCGKSSAVRSGVIPAVRKAALPGSDGWLVATMIPGAHPFVELEAALLRSRLDAPETLRSHLDGSSDEILRAALRMAPTDAATVLIVIDQFEELFTVCEPAMADRFLTGIVEAALDPRMRVRFLLTLRADFYDRPLTHPTFGTAMSSGIVNVVPMAPEELEQAAAGPAQRVGVRLEPGLEAALIGDVLGEPGALPLFEFALTDLFDRRVGDTLTLDAYRTMGGIDGSVSRKAEHLYGRLTPDQQAAAKQVFLRLVSISDGETRSRRRVDASELLGLGIDVGDLQTVLESFGQERLVSFDRSDVTGSPTVEVAHEALLERWERLAGWIADAEVDVKQNARLAALAAEWIDHDRDDAYLLSEGRYNDYSAWADQATMTLAKPEREFLEASRQAYADREQAEASRIAKEHATARRAKRNAWSLVGVVLVVVIAGGYLLWNALQPAGPTVAYIDKGELGGIPLMIRTGFDRAAHDFDIEARYEAVQGDMELRIRELAEQGTDLIIVGQDFGEFAQDIHDEYPDTQFVTMDTLGQGEANLAAVTFDDHGGAYLMGVAAALKTKTGRVGVILGVQSFFMTQFAGGFEAGVRSVDPDIEVAIDFVSSDVEPLGARGLVWNGFFRDDLAYDAAMHMYEQGADVIFSAAGEAGQGIIRAATDYSTTSDASVWAIGVDSDEAFTTADQYQARVLTSMVKKFDEAIYQSVESFVDGTIESSLYFGFHNNGISYSRQGGFVDDIADILDSTAARRASQEIEIPWSPQTPISWSTPADGSATVTYDGTNCRIDDFPELYPDDIANFAVVNDTDDFAVFGVGLVPAGLPESHDDGVTTDSEAEVLHTFSWTLAPHTRSDLRSVVLGDPFGAVSLACFPSEEFDGDTWAHTDNYLLMTD